MSEQPETTPQETAPAGGPVEAEPIENVLGSEPGAEQPEETEAQTAPAPDFDAISAATEAHNTTVEEAHKNLAARMDSAYAELKTELDKARQVWENAVKDAKAALPFVSAAEGVIKDVEHDPTRAK